MNPLSRRTLLKTGLAVSGSAMVSSVFPIRALHATAPQFLTFNGGGEGGAWHLGAAAMGEFARQIWPGVSTTAQAAGGKLNARQLGSERIEFGFMFALDVNNAYNGTGDFEERKLDNLRAVMSTNVAYTTMVAKPGIHSYRDLAGNAVAPGRAGFTGLETYRILAEEYGVADEVREINSGYGEVPSLYKDGVVSAAIVIGSIPHPVIDEILSSHEGNILSVDGDIAERMIEKYGYERVTIPAGTFRGQDDDVPTIGSVTQIATHANVPEDVVYEMTKAVWENRPRMIQAHRAYEELDDEMVLMGVRIPLHPGAERYWREVGLAG